MESFPASQYSKLDDILVYSLFVSKKNLRYRRRLQPPSVFRGDTETFQTAHGIESYVLPSTPSFTNEDASILYPIYRDSVSKDNMTSQSAINQASRNICSSMPHLFTSDDSAVLHQHVIADAWFFSRLTLLCSSLSRYSILYSSESPVAIEKVSFGDNRISAGLEATETVPAASPILRACGSISSDIVSDRQAVSLVNSADKRYPGSRLVLGRFRFANHDCNPNCQFAWIPHSRAFTIWTLREISPGQPVTIQYARDNSYFAHGSCRCHTCTGRAPQPPPAPVISRPKPTHFKATRRAGKKVKIRKQRHDDLPEHA